MMWRKMNPFEMEMDIASKFPKVQWIFVQLTYAFSYLNQVTLKN